MHYSLDLSAALKMTGVKRLKMTGVKRLKMTGVKRLKMTGVKRLKMTGLKMTGLKFMQGLALDDRVFKLRLAQTRF